MTNRPPFLKLIMIFGLFWGSSVLAQPDFGYESCHRGGRDDDNEYCYWVRGIADGLDKKAKEQYVAIRDTIADGGRFNQFRRPLVPFLDFLSKHPEAMCVDAFRSTIPEIACTFGAPPNVQGKIFRGLISMDVNSGPNDQVITPIEQMNEELRAFRENDKNRYAHLSQLQGDGTGNKVDPSKVSDGPNSSRAGLTGSSGNGSAVSQNGGSQSSGGGARSVASQGGFTSTPKAQNTDPQSSKRPSAPSFGQEFKISTKSDKPSVYSAYARSFNPAQSRSRSNSNLEGLVFANGPVEVQRQINNDSQPIDSRLNFTPDKKSTK